MTSNRPNIIEINSKISKLQNLDLKRVAIEEIEDTLTLLFTGYTLSTPIYEPGQVIYRGISYDVRPDNISFLWHPPNDKAKINRASREGQAIFYGATMREIPFFELDVKLGERLVVSKWKTVKELLVNHIGYTEDIFENLNSNREKPELILNKRENIDEVSVENVTVRNYFAEQFCQKISNQNPEIYKLTIAIAEKHYFQSINSTNPNYTEGFNALLYPTIAMRGNGDNFAIKPSFVLNGGLEFISVEYVEVIGIQDFKYEINTLAESNTINQDGTIIWEERIQHWSKLVNFEDLTFDFEDGKWVARDDDGNVVDPDN